MKQISNSLCAWLGTFSLLAMLAGCAGIQHSTPTATTSTPPAPATTLQYSAKRIFAPARPLTVKADCSWVDENGYNGKMKLHVAEAAVKDFSATVTHPDHGSCRFNMADFRQTRQMPNIELQANHSRCTVRMWSQGRQVTVAFSSCNAMCSGNAVDYLWPILTDAPTGTCG